MMPIVQSSVATMYRDVEELPRVVSDVISLVVGCFPTMAFDQWRIVTMCRDVQGFPPHSGSSVRKVRKV